METCEREKSSNVKYLAERLAPSKHSIKGSYHNYDYFSQVSVQGSPKLKVFCLVLFPSQTAPFFSQVLQFLSCPVPITQTPMHL